MQNENEFPEVKIVSLLNLCRYLDRGRLPSVIAKEIQERLGDAWGLFEQLRLNHLEWNPESKSAAETALARLASRAVSMLSGDNDRTGRNTIKAMRTLKLCLDVLPGEAAEIRSEVILISDPDPLRAAAARHGQQLAKTAAGGQNKQCEPSYFSTVNVSNEDLDLSLGPKKAARAPLVILDDLRQRIGDGRVKARAIDRHVCAFVENEQIGFIEELQAALDRESVKAARQKLKEASIREGLSFIQALLPQCADAEPRADTNAVLKPQHEAMPAAPLELQTKKSLLELCREFDAIDLSECNRRLEAGEKFDAACEEAMEKRVALGEQIKSRLAGLWGDFERNYEQLLSLSGTHRHPAEAVLEAMILGECEDMLHGKISPATSRTWRVADRLRILVS